MRLLTTTAIVAALSIGQVAYAGGLSDEIMEAPVVMAEPAPEPGPSINPTYVVLGVLAALLIAAAVQEEDDDSDDTDTDQIGASDIRLKTDITQIGETADGIGIYSYRYLGHDALFSGVMAQEVAQVMPEAVITLPGGYMMVNYSQLGLTMERLD
ncbi:MAG: tail fiber domain-containing protein [Pseudomonadota bacterium]